MASTLSTSTFGPHALRAEERHTLIEDMPQISVRKAGPQNLTKPTITSPLSDDFPTPRENLLNVPIEDVAVSPTSSDTLSDDSSLFSKRSSRSDFDDLYDITESESEGDVQIKLSSSLKRQVARRSRYPSIAIPSPSQWPTIEKLKSGITPLSPPTKIEVAPAVLRQLRTLRVPNKSATPSLDGSITDEELALSSCPSTPDIAVQHDGQWEAPIQLDPTSIALLAHINGEEAYEHLDTVIEVPEEAISEMRQIVESPPLTARMRISTQNLAPANATDADDELSALSVPSPGGFFASLDTSVARSTWSTSDAIPNTGTATEFYGVPFRSTSLPTSTAAEFYGVPWKKRPENPVEHTISLASPQAKKDPITARKMAFSPTDVIKEVEEIDETYDDALQETASVNIDRTQLWLNAQSSYMKAICEESDVTDSFAHIEDAIPKTPELASPASADVFPSKKSVRFAEAAAPSSLKRTATINKRVSPIHDGTFWQGWSHTKRSARARDVFQHRQARAEAEHVKRASCQQQHIDQLKGKFEITSAQRPEPHRPISTMLPTAQEDEKKEVIERAERERQALEQMQTSSWHVAAQKEINGGKLLTSPIVESFKGRSDVRVLDLVGQVHCSWAWDVAAEHPNATVYSTVSSDAEAHVAESTLEGPFNHCVVAAPKTWELPFDSDYFDVISARNLYSHLKTTWPKGEAVDEYDLTLRECLRCLKPGGYLEFDLLDAELVHPEAALQALGVEFAFNLKTRGYDPTSGKNFLPRLKRAGFSSIKRAWMVLPVGDVNPKWTDAGKASSDAASTVERTIGPNGEVAAYEPPMTGSTKDVRAMTGLVGARMWEQWMLKLNSEMGRSEERCLEGVAKALAEGGQGNCAWRCLVGWARKA